MIANCNEAYTKHGHAEYLATINNNNKPLPMLHWLHAIKNQEKGTSDQRTNAIRGGANKAEGVKPGVADVFLPYPMQSHHGLYIEMKKPKKGVIGDKQEEFRNYCLSVGYAHYYCYTWQEGVAAICEYLGLT